MAVIVKVSTKDAKLQSLAKRFKRGSAEQQLLLKRWGFIYLAKMRQRFNKFSRGSGDWPPLQPATIKRKRSRIILKDLGVLFNAFNPGAPGNLFKVTKDSVQVGIGGDGRHPGGVTIADLAQYHHTGAGRLPVRTIIVPPDQALTEQFIAEARRRLTDRL